MAITLARIDQKRKETAARIDHQVEQILADHTEHELANQRNYAQAIQPWHEHFLAVQTHCGETLNATLTRLLAEKVAGQALLDDGTQAKELQALDAAFEATRACYRELGLDELVGPLQEKLQSDKAACFEKYAALRAPSESAYQESVRLAFENRNCAVQSAHSAYETAINPLALDHKRERRRLALVKHEALLVCAEKRDAAAQELHAWTSAIKEERFQMIESFLLAPCAYTLRQQLENAMADKTKE